MSKRKQQPTGPSGWSVTVRPEPDGTKFRCVILQFKDGRVVGEVAGDPVDRTSAMAYAEGAVRSLVLGSTPHLPNAVYREVA